MSPLQLSAATASRCRHSSETEKAAASSFSTRARAPPHPLAAAHIILPKELNASTWRENSLLSEVVYFPRCQNRLVRRQRRPTRQLHFSALMGLIRNLRRAQGLYGTETMLLS